MTCYGATGNRYTRPNHQFRQAPPAAQGLRLGRSSMDTAETHCHFQSPAPAIRTWALLLCSSFPLINSVHCCITRTFKTAGLTRSCLCHKPFPRAPTCMQKTPSSLAQCQVLSYVASVYTLRLLSHLTLPVPPDLDLSLLFRGAQQLPTALPCSCCGLCLRSFLLIGTGVGWCTNAPVPSSAFPGRPQQLIATFILAPLPRRRNICVHIPPPHAVKAQTTPGTSLCPQRLAHGLALKGNSVSLSRL